jgi:hypothetical protein
MRSLWLGGGVALAVRDDPTHFWSKALGFGFGRPVTREQKLFAVAQAFGQLTRFGDERPDTAGQPPEPSADPRRVS